MQMIDNLKDNFSHLFNFEDDFKVGDYSFDLYAKYYQENLKYFGSKKLKIYEFTNNEHLFIKDLKDEKFNLDKVLGCFLYMYDNFIDADENHMSSLITLIYLVDGVDDEMIKKIKKFKFYKSYKFGFRGYVNGKLIVLDKNQHIAYENKMARGDAARLKLLS